MADCSRLDTFKVQLDGVLICPVYRQRLDQMMMQVPSNVVFDDSMTVLLSW